MSGSGRDSPPDLEIDTGWRAGRASWQRRGRVEVRTTGDLDTEELSRSPDGPDEPEPGRSYRGAARRWRFAAWLGRSD